MIRKIGILPADDLARNCWDGLRRFRNTEWVKQTLIEKHQVSKSQFGNIHKQAEQIRFCLDQAMEYFNAAKNVGLATKPVLLYYSIMSFALAEILYKQTGESSLDRARQQHRHHGLIFGENGKTDGDVLTSLGSLAAYPLIDGSSRKGSFELWHRTARHLPVSGLLTRDFDTGYKQHRYTGVLHFTNQRLPLLPEKGITLLEILKFLPRFFSVLPLYGISSNLCRGEFEATVFEKSDRKRSSLIIHPGPPELIEAIANTISFSPHLVDQIDIVETPNSLHITLKDSPSVRPYVAHWPDGINLDAKRVMFFATPLPVNEFGLLYLALFITGSYARYYPDKWVKLIECSHPLAMLIESLVSISFERIPILSCSELSETAWVKEAPL